MGRIFRVVRIEEGEKLVEKIWEEETNMSAARMRRGGRHPSYATVCCAHVLYTFNFFIMCIVHCTMYNIQSCLRFMRTIARKRLVLFYRYDVKALNLRMNQMSKV